jgi:hypothetical protein
MNTITKRGQKSVIDIRLILDCLEDELKQLEKKGSYELRICCQKLRGLLRETRRHL